MQPISHLAASEKHVVGYLETKSSVDLGDHAECTVIGACDLQSMVALVPVMSTNAVSGNHATGATCAIMQYMPTANGLIFP